MSTANGSARLALPLISAGVGVVLALAMIFLRNQAHGAMPIFIAPFAVAANVAAMVLGGRRRVHAALIAGIVGLGIVAFVAYRAVF